VLHVAIAAGLVLGIVTGLLGAAGSDLFLTLALASEPLGTAFISAIRMVIIPLVMAVIFTGVARLGDPRKLGRLGGTTILFFWATVVPAILIGMGVMWLALAFAPEVAVPEAAAREAPELPGLVDFLVGLIPSNPFAAAAQGSLLQLIVFSALFAAAAGALDEGRRTILIDLADAVSEALIKLVWWILWTAPLGIFGLAAPVTAQLGWGLIQSLAVFVIAVVLALGLYISVVYLPFLRFVGGIGPLRFLGGTFGAASIAFSTTSTAAALPVTLEETKRELGVSETVADLVLPLGASMYRAGSALFQGAAIVFLADLYAVSIPPAAVGGAVLATFMVSLTVAPVPSSGVMTLAPALDTVGIPLSGLSILLGIDRVPDMFRSTTNLLGQITTAVVVDGWVGGDDASGDPAQTGATPPRTAPRAEG
jgi:Na+/H+-dicarboxylate symporter